MAVDRSWHNRAHPHRTLRRGMRGDDVKAFERALNERLDHIPDGARLKVLANGQFGDADLRAWRAVRGPLGLPADHPPTMRSQLYARNPRRRDPVTAHRAKVFRAGMAAPRIITAAQIGLSFQYIWGRKLPVAYFGEHYSGDSPARTADELIAKARSYHATHRGRGWGGLSYEYLVAPGVIVCGNPTDRLSAAVAAFNSRMTGVCVPGTTGDRIDAGTAATLRWLRDNAHTTKLPSAHRMPRPIRELDCRGHQNFPGQSTSCPGDYLPTYEEIFG